MTTETAPALTGRTEQTPEQTPAQDAHQAWQDLSSRITPTTIRGVIAAELAYAQSLRQPNEPMGPFETLLTEAGAFRNKNEKRAAARFFAGKLESALGAIAVARIVNESSPLAEEQAKTCSATLHFINSSIVSGYSIDGRRKHLPRH